MSDAESIDTERRLLYREEALCRGGSMQRGSLLREEAICTEWISLVKEALNTGLVEDTP